jgi:hypothetical protein
LCQWILCLKNENLTLLIKKNVSLKDKISFIVGVRTMADNMVYLVLTININNRCQSGIKNNL